MTGFGSSFLETPECVQRWEIRSVNNRYLDIKWRLPALARSFEPLLEKMARKYGRRGRLDIALKLQLAPDRQPAPVFDAVQASAMLDSLAALAAQRQDKFAPDYAALLSLPALWQDMTLDANGELAEILEKGLALALENWNSSRAVEGCSLERDLLARFELMEKWLQALRELAPEVKAQRVEQLRTRLEEILDSVHASLDESRFLQEVVILTDKVDVSEELTRLGAHLARLRELTADGSDAGKRLDFTLQECFREINTCGNKLADARISPIIVDFKNELEKCREQVQNLE